MSYKAKVCFLSSVHSLLDVRVFYKEAKTLVRAGYEVVLIVQHDRDEVVDGVRVVPLPRPKNRLDRMTRLAWKSFMLAIKEQADVYHFHAPELIPIGLLLKLLGKKVIYDVHEAFGEKIPSKEWIRPRQARFLISKLFPQVENALSRFFDHIIVADSFVAKQFKRQSVTVIANYPVLSMVKARSLDKVRIRKIVGRTIAIYVGGLTRERGLLQMVKAMEFLSDLDVELHLLGRLDDPEDEELIKQSSNVKYFGFVTLEKVFEYLALADIGLAVFQPTRAYLYAGENTNKLFEYMACKLAVVVSDFPNLRRIVEGAKCGICVDPTSPQEIAAAIRYLHENPEVRMQMGESGFQAVLSKYNWERESEKLLEIYNRLVSENEG
jgi:glycosyltransferase involved in cell wall biosynthesis